MGVVHQTQIVEHISTKDLILQMLSVT